MWRGDLAVRSFLCLAILAFFAGTGWSQVPAKRKVAVFDFDNAALQGAISSSNFQTHAPEVGKSVSELLITKLVKDGNAIVVERSAIDKVLAEQNLSNSDRSDPATAAKLGRLLGVDAIVLGTITRYDYDEKIKRGSKFFDTARSPKAKYDISAKVQISTRLVSPNTAEVVSVSEGIGETTRQNVKIDLRDTGGRLLMASGVNSPVMNESIDKAVAQLAAKLETELVKVSPLVLEIDGLVADADDSGHLVLNVGARHGVKVGDRLKVLRAGKEIRDPVNGRLLMRDDTVLGEAVVTLVNDVSAIAEYHGTEAARVRDVVRSIPR